MTDELKALIENAEYREVGDYDILMIVPNGIYDGFWGVNGYDNIMLLGKVREEDKWYIVSDKGADVLDIERIGDATFHLDIPSKYGMPTIWFRTPIHIDRTTPISSITGVIR